MPRSAARVLIADSQRLFVDALAEGLKGKQELIVVGTATTAKDVLCRVAKASPTVVLLDTHFEDRGAFDLAAELAADANEAKSRRLVFLTHCLSDILIRQALQLSAGYLMKTESLANVVDSLRLAAAGGMPFSPPAARRVRFNAAQQRYELKATDEGRLTGRQMDVLRQLAEGGTTRQLAATLGLTEKGAESARYRLMQRLGLRDRVELVRWAIRAGVLRP